MLAIALILITVTSGTYFLLNDVVPSNLSIQLSDSKTNAPVIGRVILPNGLYQFTDSNGLANLGKFWPGSFLHLQIKSLGYPDYNATVDLISGNIPVKIIMAPAPSRATTVEPGWAYSCTDYMFLDGTTPVDHPGNGGTNTVGTLGQDWGAFMQARTNGNNQAFCFEANTTTYDFTSAVTFSAGKTTVKGAGMGKTILNLPVSYSGDLFTVSGLSYFQAFDLTIQGNAFSPFPTATAQNSGTMIHSVGSTLTKSIVKGVEFINVNAPWTAESGGSDLEFTGNFVTKVATGPTVYSNGGTIARVIISENTILNSRDDAIAIISNGQPSAPHNTTQVNVVNNVVMKADASYATLTGAGIKVDFGTASARDMAMITVANNNLRTHNAGSQGGGANETGIAISGTPYQGYASSIPALQISTNTIWGFTKGISIAGNTQTYLSRINNNIITYVRWQGIWVQAQRYTEFEHNTIQSDSTISSGTFGIVLTGNSNNLLFDFNDFHGFASSNAVFIGTGLTLSNVIFEWNDFSDIGNTVTNLGSTGTIWKYNRNYATEASGSVTGLSCTSAALVTSTVTHGLVATPVWIQMTISVVTDTTARFGGLWSSTLGATTFVANIPVTTAPATCTFAVYWYAQTWNNP